VKLYGDNQGAIALTRNPHIHERSKHIDICYHFIRALVEKELVDVEYVPTMEMVADGMTKPLERVAFDRFKRQLVVVDSGRVRGKRGRLSWGNSIHQGLALWGSVRQQG
jgi:hypothetical protein